MMYYTMNSSISTTEVVFYHKVCNFPWFFSTVNCSILQQNIVVYHKKQCFTTKCDILPQSVVIP